ncbi:MAG: hypothetical protein KF683_10180 [Rubrivivax sp.]|nr:hypothetical protein [Rubrivivax sp.]
MKAGAPAAYRVADPYLVWLQESIAGLDDLATRMAGGSALDPRYVHLLVEKRDPEVDPWHYGLVPVHLHAEARSGTRATRFVSCLFNLNGTERFSEFMQKTGQAGSDIVRVELSGLHVADQIGLTIRHPPRVPEEEQGVPMVCVIDDRPNALSSRLHQSGRGCVRTIWHQGGSADTLRGLDGSGQWDSAFLDVHSYPGESSFRQSAFFGRRTTLDVGSPGDTNDATGDRASSGYRRLWSAWPPPGTSHGSAVLDLIAGHTLWTGWRPGPVARRLLPRPVRSRPRPPRIHFVQLPIPTVLDTSGGTLAAAVLDGIHDALAQADDGQNVIVNISFGTHSGGHDGSSMLERAMVELLFLYDGSPQAQGKTLHIVLPAGNSHLWRCHACARLEAERPHALHWKVQPDNPADSFVELWFDEAASARIALTSPGGATTCIEISATDQNTRQSFIRRQRNDGGEVRTFTEAGLVSPRMPTQSTRGRMVLVAVSATGWPNPPAIITNLGAEPSDCSTSLEASSHRRTTVAEHGVWKIEVTAHDASAGVFHAWVQRSDTAPLRGRAFRGYQGRQSYFLDLPDAGVEPTFTLNGIATAKHQRLFVVGAMRRHDDCLALYGAAGPNRGETSRTEGPDWVVHVDESRNQPGLLVASFLGGAAHRVTGTSMAAAVLTRHLYEHLAAGGTAATFDFRTECDGGCDERVAEGAPRHAHPLHRGIWRRVVPRRDDGSL